MTSPTAIDLFRGEYRFLSNFCPAPVTLSGVTYPTVEHAFQAAKTTDVEERQQILACKTPGEAKRLGRTVHLDPNWDEYRQTFMIGLLRQKFSRPPFRQLLLDTGDRVLIEGNAWRDTYWGVCNGIGENHLGKLLMRVRDEIQR
ncbi:hypothetical protein LCGC14_1895220 [marine sediment metagenome]|uniref:NADAR domain-containing protein n=1 Tax=marine sediment metagenome TaxID=412755 RepID=A0A0F9IWD3_9ZZZZ